MSEEKETKEEIKQKHKLAIEITEKFTQLITGGFGLVAALAWNDAIQGFFKMFFKKDSGLKAQFIYAVIITLLIIIIIYYMTTLAEKVKNRLR